MPNFASVPVQHYQWAGLDFMFDADGTPVLLEANRCSHMLWEYLLLYKNDMPFRHTAEILNAADGPTCLMWRRNDPLPDADEDACWISGHLRLHLDREVIICHVEDNQQDSDELLTRQGKRVRPGSIFRWWYDLPWSYERSGVRVINPNAAWVAVRDKLDCYTALKSATSFRVPRSFAVETPSEAAAILSAHPNLFERGYVIKPRVGFGGHGVQVADPHDPPQSFFGNHLLSERIIPQLRDGNFWDVRLFVMAGRYLGGVLRTSPGAVTNVFQGGTPQRLDDETAAALQAPALEAVQLLDAAAEAVHCLPHPPDTDLTNVEY
ncbi:ATP-grasp domain-containing protein [Symmachiella dynata]|uniref:ATP-grasp domain-containing protein n=1 Tax=Symmachiella dynata TaxID=2527995 RepID=UPI0030EC264C